MRGAAMSKRQGIVRPLGLALVLAIGSGAVWPLPPLGHRDLARAAAEIAW